MKELDGLDPSSTRVRQLLTQLINETSHHVSDEENALFPRLRGCVWKPS